MKSTRTSAESFPGLGDPQEHPWELGGKGKNLDRLRRRGFPVPEGFVVPAEVCWAESWREETQRLLRGVGASLESAAGLTPETLTLRHPETEPLVAGLRPRVAAHLSAWQGAADVRFAVRSSAPAEDGERCSFAGLLESFLGVPAAYLPEAIVLCWSSAWSQRLSAYHRRTAAEPGESAIAVVVQRIVPARAAGVLLTHDPVSGRAEPLINAVRGLAGGLVDGSLMPDSHRRREGNWVTTPGHQAWQEVLTLKGVVRQDLSPAEQQRPALSPRECERLARLAERVEAEMGGPQDLEWAIEGNRVWLLQARPITTLPEPERTWTRANLKELYPDLPSPMTVSLVERYKTAWIREQFSVLGYRVDGLGPAMRAMQGRLYFNQTLLEGLASSLGFSSEWVQRGVGGAAPETPPTLNWRSLARHAGPLVRVCSSYFAAPWFAAGAVRGSERTAEALAGRPVEDATDAELLESAVHAYRALAPLDDAAARVMGGIEMWTVIATALQRGNRAPADSFLAAAISADPANPTARQVRQMEELGRLAETQTGVLAWLDAALANSGDWENGWTGVPAALAGTAFGTALGQFLDAHGTRAVHESDSAVPRFAEDPTPVLASIRAAALAGPLSPRGAGKPKCDARKAPALPLRLVSRVMRRLFARREQVRHGITRLIWEQRRCEVELGRRWAARGWLRKASDYHHLRLEDAMRALAAPAAMDAGWLRERVQQRQAQQEAWEAVWMPDVWTDTGDPAPMIAELPEAGGDGAWAGLPLSPGVVEGRVVVVDSLEFPREVPAGCILVLPVVGPSWTPLFASARGAVVEMAGVLSHGAIMLREFGLPAVGNVPGATVLFQTGDVIRLDGTRGTIEVLSEARSGESLLKAA